MTVVVCQYIHKTNGLKSLTELSEGLASALAAHRTRPRRAAPLLAVQRRQYLEVGGREWMQGRNPLHNEAGIFSSGGCGAPQCPSDEPQRSGRTNYTILYSTVLCIRTYERDFRYIDTYVNTRGWPLVRGVAENNSFEHGQA